MSDCNTLTTTRYGPMLCNRHDEYVGRSLLRYGEYSEGETALFRTLLAPGDVVIEAGANIGALTVPLAQHVGPTGRVLAFEPQRLAFQLLCANVALNSLTNVEARQAALGASRGTLPVPMLNPDQPQNIGGLAVRGHATGEPVPLMRLDDYGELAKLHLLKADVEGMELAVVLGANRAITTHWPHLYLECDRQDQAPALIGTLEQYGYRLWVHEPPLYHPENFRAERENVFTRGEAVIVSINLLGIHASREVPDGLAEVPHLRSLAEIRAAASATP